MHIDRVRKFLQLVHEEMFAIILPYGDLRRGVALSIEYALSRRMKFVAAEVSVFSLGLENRLQYVYLLSTHCNDSIQMNQFRSECGTIDHR